MTPEHQKYQQTRADFDDDIPSHGTMGPQWSADQIARAERQDACYIERLARKDFEPARFANLRNGGNLPRAKPGRIRLWIGDAISLLLIIAMCVAFYVVMP